MAAIVDAEKQATLLQFREKVADLLPGLKSDIHRSDAILNKFLIACAYNVQQAEEMFRKTVEWRRSKNVNAILERPFFHDLDQYYKLLRTGSDKTGRPLYIGQVGRWDPNGLLHPQVKTEAGTIVIQFLEKALDACTKMSKDGELITTGFGIIDCAEFDYTWLTYKDVVTTCLSLLAENLQMILSNYPECAYKVVVVNAPSVFHIVWAVVKPLLPPEWLARIYIYGAYSFGSTAIPWKDFLLQHIDADVLPSLYGGANTCGLLDSRVEVDKVFVPVERKLELLPPGELIEYYIPAGKTFTFDITTEPGDELLWNFKTETYDIEFKLECNDGRGVIIDKCRCDAHKLVQKGWLKCPSKAKYTFTWDNYYSYMTGKKLFYAVKVRSA